MALNGGGVSCLYTSCSIKIWHCVNKKSTYSCTFEKTLEVRKF